HRRRRLRLHARQRRLQQCRRLHRPGRQEAPPQLRPDDYAGLKSMIYAGLTKNDPRVKAAWDWISKNWTVDEHAGMRAAGEDKAKAGMYYYYYTMARALDVYDEPTITDAKGTKHDWRLELIAKLETLQQPDGSWVGEKSWMENNPILATSYVVM